MGVPVLVDENILIGKAEDMPDAPLPNILQVKGADKDVFKGNCPLWTYILAEAATLRLSVQISVSEPETFVNTPQLGPVGGTSSPRRSSA